MAKVENNANITQSILDRLTEADGGEMSQLARARPSDTAPINMYKRGVRRDLQWLLNTKRTPEPADETWVETHRSLYNYGIPDFSTLNSNSFKDRNRLLEEMQEAIEFFEPRLRKVKISLLNSDGVTTKILKFQIEATLMMDPAPERISFETVLDVVSGDYEVKGDRGA